MSQIKSGLILIAIGIGLFYFGEGQLAAPLGVNLQTQTIGMAMNIGGFVVGIFGLFRLMIGIMVFANKKVEDRNKKPPGAF